MIHEQSKLSLFLFYKKYVNNVIFTTLKDEAFQRSKVYRQYVESYAVEWDADIFQIMLRKVDLTVSDIGDLRMTRLSNKLLSYSVSLSPGLIYIVQRIASCHVEASKMDAMKSHSFQSISLLNQTQIQAAEPIAWTKSLQSGKLNMDRTVENNTRNQKAEETLILEQSKGCFRDDMTGKDHVEYSEYANAIAHLVIFHLEAPCVFGMYAAWGVFHYAQD